jgi:DNA-binding transcriptional regulator YdaS (Cro superfamily)
MANKKLLKIEEVRGKPLDRIIPPLVNKGGQAEAARDLGVSQATISQWLKDNHYVQLVTYVKDITPEERAEIAHVVKQLEE